MWQIGPSKFVWICLQVHRGGDVDTVDVELQQDAASALPAAGGHRRALP